MHYRQAINIIRQTMLSAEDLGVTVPASMRRESVKLAELADKVRALDPPSSLAEAVLTALENDRDIATDAGVHAAIALQTVQESTNGIDYALSRRATAFLTEHAETMLGVFGEPFAGYADAVHAAVEKFGDTDPDDTNAILSRGGDAAQVWAAAQDASKGIGDIRQTWKMLSNVASAFSTDPRYQVLTIAEIPAAEFIDGEVNGWLTPWEIAQRGWKLSLATPATYRERVASVRAELGRRATTHAGAFREGYQRFAGHGVS